MSPLLIGIIFTVLGHVAFAGMRLAVALDAIHQGASAALVGLITALFALLPAVGSVLMGRFIDRHGSKLLNVVCPSLLALAALLAALLPSLSVLALAGLVTGGAYLTMHILNQHLVGRLSKPEDRPANFALAATYFAASSTLAPVLAGYSIDHAGFRWTYILLAAVPLLSLLLVAFKKLPPLEGRAPAVKSAATGGVLALLQDANLRRVYVINVIFGTAWDVFLFMTPLYGASLKLSASQIGIIIACFSSATFAVRLFARPISRRFTPWQVLIGSLVVGGASTLAFGLSGIVVLLMIFAFIMGLGHGMANPMMNTLLYEAAPSSRMAEVLGLRTTASMGLQVGIPIVAGALGAVIGIAPLFWLVSGMQLSGAYTSRANWRLKKSSASRST